MKEYYGANACGRDFVNKVLNISSTGKEQDWEIEFANPSRLREMLDIGYNSDLNFDQKAALSLLIIASADLANEIGEFENEFIKDIRDFIRSDTDVLRAMIFFWIFKGRALDRDFVRSILK